MRRISYLNYMIHSCRAIERIDYTWLIKDNASKDDTVAQASSWDGNIKVIPYKDNKQNFSEGCNFLFECCVTC